MVVGTKLPAIQGLTWVRLRCKQLHCFKSRQLRRNQHQGTEHISGGAWPGLLQRGVCLSCHAICCVLYMDGGQVKGNPVKIPSEDTSVLVLEFWATWCGPCVQTVPVRGLHMMCEHS